MNLLDFINTDYVFCNSKAETTEEAREFLAKSFAKKSGIDAKSIIDALIEREKLSSTVIAPGLAFPHVRENFLDDFYVIIGCFPEGVKAPGEDEPVKLIICYLVPEGKSNLYLRVMSGMVKLLANPENQTQIINMQDTNEVYRFISDNNITIGEIVTAADLMETDFVSLPEDATLREAADMMVEHKITDVPIVDKNGNFLGSVTTGRLLKVGIPEYLLMMDNLNFLKTFEPFQDLLKNEQSMHVKEVMKNDVLSFAADTPMIQVAGKLVDSHVELGVVLEGKKLVGTITRYDFIHKVVRV